MMGADRGAKHRSAGQKLADEHDRQTAACDIDTSYIVEAAAGTGKTTLLVDRILNLIRAEHAAPEQIVAITFTERAAAELKIKIQDRLSEALAEAPGGEDRHLAEALWGLERMQVTTIHAFCAALIRERPVEAGVDPNFDVADELTASLIRDEIWEQWLTERMRKDDPAIRRAVTVGIKTSNMQELAYNILQNRDVLAYLPQPAVPRLTTEAFIGKLRRAIPGLTQMVKVSCKDPSDTAAVMIADLETALKELDYLESDDDKAAHLFTGLGDVLKSKRRGAKTRWASVECLELVRGELDMLRQAYTSFSQSFAHNIVAELADSLRDFVGRYKRTMLMGAKLDFHDLLSYARDMLKNHPEVRAYFHRRYTHVLVDEFQDTDPLQAEIIFFLTEADGKPAASWEEVRVAPGRLFLVGDPKQSIYRFRRADIEMYAAAKAGMGENRTLTIFQNFRCAESIVRSVNEIFADLIKQPSDGAYQPDYVALKVGRARSEMPARQGVLLVYPPEGLWERMSRVNERRRFETRAVAVFIRKLVDEHKWTIWDKSAGRLRPVMLKDIAVLLRAHTPLDALEDALKAYGVDYRVIGGKHFFIRQEIQQLLAVMLAIDNPYDKVALIAALRSPFFGTSDEAIFLFHAGGGHLNYLEDAGGTPLEGAFNLLRDLHNKRNDMAPEQLLRDLYGATKATVVFLLRPGGEQRVHNLLKIGDIARALAERGVRTFRGLVRWLEERRDEEAHEAEAATVETGDNFVRILTVHKAKGLEFPVVILSDLASGRSKREPFIVDRRKGKIAAVTGRAELAVQTLDYESIRDYENNRRDAEEKRLLYVAMTRARDLLVVPVYWATPKELDKGSGKPKEGSLLHYLADKIPRPDQVTEVPLAGGMSLYDVSNLDLEPQEPPPLRLVIGKQPGVAKSIEKELADWRNVQDEIRRRAHLGRALRSATEDVPGEEATASRPGLAPEPAEAAGFGTLVHRLFELTDWQKPELVGERAAIEAEDLGLPGEKATKAAKMVLKVLGGTFIQRILKSDAYYKEIPFAFKQNGTIIEGKIDVVFREGDAMRVVDFKTDRISSKDLKVRAERYRPQAAVYSDAIEAVTGAKVEEVIFYFVAPDETVSLSP
jgi:ATP-dependent helicase/nuclease subunit A